ncbi:MAG: hypothetical protein ABSF12_26900 [Bryobacteraceae bacterium]
MSTLTAKEQRLLASLQEMSSVIVAYSGGADSAYLAWAAHRALGDRAVAITADSASLPDSHKADAEEFAREHGFRHEYIATYEFDNPDYVKNDRDRCFHCKDELFTRLDEVARERGIAHVIYGVNVDDLGDYRPGQRAAKLHQVKAPLVDAELAKAEIRELSKRAGLKRRIEDLGPAGVGMLELADSVRDSGDDTECEDSRSGRGCDSGARVQAVPCAIPWRRGADRNCAGRAGAGDDARNVAGVHGDF